MSFHYLKEDGICQQHRCGAGSIKEISMSALSVLILVFVVGAAIIAILSQTRPSPNLLWVSIILLCVAIAVIEIAPVAGYHR
jgi:uncharacterized membrane protein YoaK (UPF0700 family)